MYQKEQRLRYEERYWPLTACCIRKMVKTRPRRRTQCGQPALEGTQKVDSMLDGDRGRNRDGAPHRHRELREDMDTESETASETCIEPARKVRRILSHVDVLGPSGAAFPRSIHEGWQLPQVFSSEIDALSELRFVFERQYTSAEDRPEYTYFTLTGFNIYRSKCLGHTHELISLENVNISRGCTELLFDGYLCFGNNRHFVKGVPFSTMTIDGYGNPDIISLQDCICIQSAQAQKQEVWYKLGRPSQEYERFFQPFLWLSQFTKYFLEYLLEIENVCLHHFRRRFYEWLPYKRSPSFRAWLSKSRPPDFCTTVTAHVNFLWKECWGIDAEEWELRNHPIWGEVNPDALTAIRQRPMIEKNTILTPFVHECFKRMYFAEYIEEREILDSDVVVRIRQQKQRLDLTPFGAREAQDQGRLTPVSMDDNSTGLMGITVGDVVCVPSDTESVWKAASSTWYAYVQAVREGGDGAVLDVIWLYEPQDTTIGKAYYPFKNELFFTDHCECGKSALPASCVVSKASVSWFVKDPNTVTGLFVRRKFRTVHDTYDFINLRHSDFKCSCRSEDGVFKECRCQYRIGDTVLVREYSCQRREDILEPCQVVDFNLDGAQVVLRWLERKIKTDYNAPPNELTVTDKLIHKPPSHIIRKCQVRFYTPEAIQDGLPIPYNFGGAGDFFFIVETAQTFVEKSDTELEDNASGGGIEQDVYQSMPPLEQGWDSTEPATFKKLKGMGIFCGGGNFDRGLEDGGAVDFHYAVDLAPRALHSYRANARDTRRLKCFLGSVNDYLAQAISGSTDQCIAIIGSINLLSAGSPCPPFSKMQHDKNSPASLRNASLVASAISYVDFYSPQYFVLENVVDMTRGMGPNKDENVFAQIIAALVALGYQVQQFLMESWSFGSPQSRPRVFIYASAPGMELLPPPPYTHSHPHDMKMREVSLGKSANGQSFGVRRKDFTTFQHVSPLSSTADLPDIADSMPQLCPAYPDHRTFRIENTQSRARISTVPMKPHGMSLAQAAQQNLLRGEALDYYENLHVARKRENSRTYSRVYPEGRFPTCLTKLHISCFKSGRTLHWSQHRPLTIMELRRAQGFLDSEVIIGSPPQQIEIIGNSVDRKVALALAFSLRQSWVDSSTSANNQDHAHELSASKGTSNSFLPDAECSFVLSQEEKADILSDPAHAFRTIRQIFEERKTSPNDETVDDRMKSAHANTSMSIETLREVRPKSRESSVHSIDFQTRLRAPGAGEYFHAARHYSGQGAGYIDKQLDRLGQNAEDCRVKANVTRRRLGYVLIPRQAHR